MAVSGEDARKPAKSRRSSGDKKRRKGILSSNMGNVRACIRVWPTEGLCSICMFCAEARTPQMMTTASPRKAMAFRWSRRPRCLILESVT